MKVLVTGSSGRVGRAIYVRLALEHEVVGLDRSPSSTADIVGDISNVELLQQTLDEVDAIVHTAALHAPHAHAHALLMEGPDFRTFVISGATHFHIEDTEALLNDAPTVIAKRAPKLVETFARRGWKLPKSIDRVYTPARAMIELDWMPRFGYSEILNMLDEQSSEVLPPG